MTVFTQLPSEYFNWSRWRTGCPGEFLIQPCREVNILVARARLQQHAVGWCYGDRLMCRPKPGHYAVMFWKDGRHFWFHLTAREFQAIFHDAR